MARKAGDASQQAYRKLVGIAQASVHQAQQVLEALSLEASDRQASV